MNKITLIYNKLYNTFGKQGWWPLTSKGLKSKHHSGRPKTEKHKFEIILGAILTQNTAWKNVEKALYNLNKNNLMDIKKIAKIEQKRLANLIRPAGYYNQKAKRLKIFSNFVLKNYNASINNFFKKAMPEIRAELLSIKGIGEETADSIILYAAEKPIFVIDAYTKRIFQRLGFRASSYDEWQKLFMHNLENNLELFKEYHALLVELGKNYCKKKPICERCPLVDVCKEEW